MLILLSFIIYKSLNWAIFQSNGNMTKQYNLLYMNKQLVLTHENILLYLSRFLSLFNARKHDWKN